MAVTVKMMGRAVGPSDFILGERLPVPQFVRTNSFPQPPLRATAHAPTAIVLADGRIAVYWFAGSREGAADVVLRMSVLDKGSWSAPRDISDGKRTGEEQHRSVRTVGNPVVLHHPSGEYWLVYVSVSVGGWSGSALNLMRSRDGIAWGPSTRLISGPAFNLSTLTKGPALLRADGLVALPVYHEMITSFPELLLIDPDGRVVDRVRMGDRCEIQPWVVPLSARRAIALMRQHGCAKQRLWVATTEDAGMSWSAPQPSEFANPDSPAAAVALPDGRIVAVLNDDPQESSVLSLVVSGDGGATWRRGAPIFDGSANRLSYRYPWLLQDSDGRLNVFVSELKRAIRHAVLGEEAIQESGATLMAFHLPMVEQLGAFLLIAGIAASAAARFAPPSRLATVVASVVAAVAVLLPVGGLSATDFLYSIIGPLSGASLVLLALGYANLLWPDKPLDRVFGVPVLSIVVIAIGVPLYGIELGGARLDLYRWGYAGWVLPAALLVLLLIGFWRGAFAIALWLLLSGAMYLADLYASRNLFDYLLDPVAVVLSCVVLARAFIVRKPRRSHPSDSGRLAD